MTEREANVNKTVEMLEYIATRTGEDRASVFLDIIIHLFFSKDDPNEPVKSGLTLIRSYVVRQQHVLNEIAAVYNIQAPVLKNSEPEPDPNEIPF